MEDQKFYQKAWFVWLTLFILTPIGILLLWIYGLHTKKARLILSIVFGIWFLFLIIGLTSTKESEKESPIEEVELSQENSDRNAGKGNNKEVTENKEKDKDSSKELRKEEVDWEKGIEKITNEKISKKEKLHKVKKLASEIEPTEEEIKEFGVFIINEFRNGEYLKNDKKEIYVLSIVFKTTIIDQYYDDLKEVKIDKFAYIFLQNIESKYLGEDKVNREVIESNEKEMREMLGLKPKAEIEKERNDKEEVENKVDKIESKNEENKDWNKNENKKANEKSRNEGEVKQKDDQQELANKFGLELVTVSRVIDGDTVELSDGRKLRLIGVNTPESTTRHEPYGKEAKEYTTSRLKDRKVWIQKDVSETDRYGRILRIVWLEVPNDDMNDKEIRNKMFNARLVLNGYAEPSTYPPDVKYSEFFVKYAREARDNHYGLWQYGPNGTTKGDLDTEQKETKNDNKSTNNNKNNSNSSNTTGQSTQSPPDPPKETFKNCTELRKVYPKGVPKDHPAYASKHDRDKDGWACEVSS